MQNEKSIRELVPTYVRNLAVLGISLGDRNERKVHEKDSVWPVSGQKLGVGVWQRFVYTYCKFSANFEQIHPFFVPYSIPLHCRVTHESGYRIPYALLILHSVSRAKIMDIVVDVFFAPKTGKNKTNRQKNCYRLTISLFLRR